MSPRGNPGARCEVWSCRKVATAMRPLADLIVYVCDEHDALIPPGGDGWRLSAAASTSGRPDDESSWVLWHPGHAPYDPDTKGPRDAATHDHA